MKTKTISVRSGAGAYRVICGAGAAKRLRTLVSAEPGGKRVFFLSAPKIWRLCGGEVSNGMDSSRRPAPVLFDDRERAKNLHTVLDICRKLVRAGADRHSILVALGGGVVGDVSGFVAASYLRGVKLVHVPTTLVAQVDSAIGGKTGVNLPEGKNLVGAFYSPRLVLADPRMLRTLPAREYRSGIYEVVKYGVIADRALFAMLEEELPRLLRRDGKTLARVILRCVRVKARVVQADEREGGLRQILNFGHTLGHALEAATHYSRFLHGEAVAWGMMAATLLSVATGRLPEKEGERILRLVARVGDLPALRGIGAGKVLRLLPGDKKSVGGRPRWVLARGIGKVEWGIELPDELITGVFASLPRVFASARDSH